MSKQPVFEHNPVMPDSRRVNHYARFGQHGEPNAEQDAREWAKNNPHEGQKVAFAPNGTWVVIWQTESKV